MTAGSAEVQSQPGYPAHRLFKGAAVCWQCSFTWPGDRPACPGLLAEGLNAALATECPGVLTCSVYSGETCSPQFPSCFHEMGRMHTARGELRLSVQGHNKNKHSDQNQKRAEVSKQTFVCYFQQTCKRIHSMNLCMYVVIGMWALSLVQIVFVSVVPCPKFYPESEILKL